MQETQIEEPRNRTRAQNYLRPSAEFVLRSYEIAQVDPLQSGLSSPLIVLTFTTNFTELVSPRPKKLQKNRAVFRKKTGFPCNLWSKLIANRRKVHFFDFFFPRPKKLTIPVFILSAKYWSDNHKIPKILAYEFLRRQIRLHYFDLIFRLYARGNLEKRKFYFLNFSLGRSSSITFS